MRVYLDRSLNTIEVGICYFSDDQEIGVKLGKWIITFSWKPKSHSRASERKPRFSPKKYEMSAYEVSQVIASLQRQSPNSQTEVWDKSTEQSALNTKIVDKHNRLLEE